jgi:hypothetical protein
MLAQQTSRLLITDDVISNPLRNNVPPPDTDMPLRGALPGLSGG